MAIVSRIGTDRSLSCDAFWRHLHETTPRPLAFRATARDGWLAWRAELGQKLRDLLGPPRQRVELRAQVLDRTDCGDYIREHVVYDTEPHVSVTAFVLLPKGPPARRQPALLCLHGHGPRGKDVVAGAAGWNLRLRRSIRRFHKNIGEQFVRRGYVCLCADARGWGERDEGFYRRGIGRKAPFEGRDPCNIHFLKAQLFGLNLQWLNTWDDMRGLDYLVSRDDVDAERMGAVGFSYGGTRALFAAALDERLRAVDVSSSLSSFYDYGIRLNNTCGSQVVPGLLQWCEMGDVAALIAPRALLCESGRSDRGFPLAAAEQAFATIRRCYDVAGVADRCEHEIWDGGHQFAAKRAFGFFDRWLGPGPNQG